jgi:UDP-N-acetylglucosamine 2-epimerase (non-hydrolysing)
MLEPIMQLFSIVPDIDLKVMSTNQTPAQVLAAVVSGMQPLLAAYQPTWVLVQGDTTTVLAATLAAAYGRCRVAHVEAGLRTYDREQPFPEELNRVLVDHSSDLLLAPTDRARQALLREGVSDASIAVTGNTVVDALRIVASEGNSRLPEGVERDDRYLILVTAHRRENHGRPLVRIIEALRRLAARGDTHIVFPMHRNPNVWETVQGELSKTPGITLLPPLRYEEMVGVMQIAEVILTDSGGIQEEAPSFGVPVLVMREKTERPEAVEAGTAKLVGTATDSIVKSTEGLLDDPGLQDVQRATSNPFGDGYAAERIVEELRRRA